MSESFKVINIQGSFAIADHNVVLVFELTDCKDGGFIIGPYFFTVALNDVLSCNMERSFPFAE
jgi:hypothetical protein